MEKFDIQVDENTKTQAALLHDDIPGYDLPTIDFVQTSIDNNEDVSILEEDNSQIYAHLDNVLVHMIDNQQTAIFKSNHDFNKNKEKILQYIKYAENWQVMSVMCSYTVIACDVLLIIAMTAFLLKYRKTMQEMLGTSVPRTFALVTYLLIGTGYGYKARIYCIYITFKLAMI